MHAQKEMRCVEAALPREALRAWWDSAAWQAQVASAGNIAELRLLLGRLEEALQDGWLSPHFPRHPLLVKGAWLPTGGLPVPLAEDRWWCPCVPSSCSFTCARLFCQRLAA